LHQLQISYVNGDWIIVSERLTSQPAEPITQTISFSKEFPKSAISEAWADCRKVCVVSYCNNEWVLVTEKVQGQVVGQSIVISSDELPSKDVQQFWNESKRISDLRFEDNVWVLLAEERVRRIVHLAISSIIIKLFCSFA